jgi:hypothetical protein
MLFSVVRAILLPEDWEKAEQGSLGFTHSQNKQIRMWMTNGGVADLVSDFGRATESVPQPRFFC